MLGPGGISGKDDLLVACKAPAPGDYKAEVVLRVKAGLLRKDAKKAAETRVRVWRAKPWVSPPSGAEVTGGGKYCKARFNLMVGRDLQNGNGAWRGLRRGTADERRLTQIRKLWLRKGNDHG